MASFPAAEVYPVNAAEEPRRLPPQWLRIAILVLLVAEPLAIVAIGVPPQRVYVHDVFILLDGAWRALHGVFSSVDYYSPLGIAYYLPLASLFRLRGATVTALPLYHALWYLIIVAPAAFVIFRSRNATTGDYAALALLSLRATSLRQLSHWPTDIGYASMYNNLGLAAGAAVLILIAQELRPGDERPAWHPSFVAGALAGVMLLLKASNGVLCFGIIALSWLARPALSRILAAAAGFFIPLAAVTLRWPGYLIANETDLRIAAGASHYFAAGNVLALLERVARDPVTYGYLLALIILCSWPGDVRTIAFRCWSIVSTIVVTAAICTTHYIPPWAMRSAGIEALLFAVNVAILLPASRSMPSRRKRFAQLSVALCLVIAVPPLFAELGAIAMSTRLVWGSDPDATEELPIPQAKGLFFTPDGGEGAEDYRAKIMEEVQLVKAFVPPGDCVVNLDFSDPVGFLAQRRPCRGPIVWHYANSFSKTSYPSSKRVFAGSSYLLIPRLGKDSNRVPGTLNLYFDSLERSTPVALSHYWFLVRLHSAGSTRRMPSG